MDRQLDRQPVDVIREAVETATGPGRRSSGGGWQLKCPAHSDRDPSLSLDANPDGDALLYCQAGCDLDAVLTAVGLRRRDLYPVRADRNTDPVVATYRYLDETGQLLYEVQRTAAKRFRQRRPDPDQPSRNDRWVYKLGDTRRVPYRLPQVVEAVAAGLPIWVVEGEKDVHTAERDGLVATCNPGGAGKWRPEYNQWFRGATVNIVADLDPQGQGMRHAHQIAEQLTAVAAQINLYQPAAGKDYTDHRLAGYDVTGLQPVTPADIPARPPQTAPVDTGPVDDMPPWPDEDTTDSGADTVPGRSNPIRLVPATAFQMRAVRWLWDNRMPIGEITLVPGREGIGKSTFLAWMASAITRGTLPGEFNGEPRAVLYAAAEDAWDYTIAPRMHAAGADLTRVYRVDVIDSDGIPGKLILPTHTRWLPEIAEEAKAAVLMCDPLLSNLDDRINPNRGNELRSALEPLRHAAESAGIAVIGLAHLNKNAEAGDILTKITGSRAWAEVARAVVAIAREDREQPDGTSQPVQVLTQIKSNLGRMDTLASLEYTIETYSFPLDNGTQINTSRLRWGDQESATTAEEILGRRPGQPGTPQRGTRRRGNVDLVLDILDNSVRAMSPREVADELERNGTLIPIGTVRQILNREANGTGSVTPSVTRVGDGLFRSSTDADR